MIKLNKREEIKMTELQEIKLQFDKQMVKLEKRLIGCELQRLIDTGVYGDEEYDVIGKAAKLDIELEY